MGRRESRRRSRLRRAPASRSSRRRPRPAARESHRPSQGSPEGLQRTSSQTKIPWLELVTLSPPKDHRYVKTRKAGEKPAVLHCICKIIQPLAEWPSPHPQRRNNLLAKWAKRGGACLHAHDLSSFPATRPEPPTGVLASGTSSTDFSLCNLFAQPFCKLVQILV